MVNGKVLTDNYANIENEVYSSLENKSIVNVVVILNSAKQGMVLSTLSSNEFTPQYLFNDTLWFSGYTNKQGIDKLKINPFVDHVYLSKPTHTLLENSLPLIHANNAWDVNANQLNITGRNQTICIVDTGVNSTHPAFNGKVVAQKCFCSNNCCPNGLTSDTNATDNDGHGTHIAGIVAANGSLFEGGLRGVAFDSKIVAVRVTNNSGSGTEPDLANGIKWCKDNKDVYNITLITVSIGTSENFSSYCDNRASSIEANNATISNLFVSVASGNMGNTTGIGVPACASNATSVGATYDLKGGAQLWDACADLTTEIDQITCFTNRGGILDLLAPGAIINSTYKNGGYAQISGTSQAAPHVAGLAALMKQANNSLTPSDIERVMNYTGKPIYDSATQLTFRRIDAFRSVLAVLYNLFVSDLQVVHSNAGNRVFQFKAFNDLSTPANVSWTINYGDGRSDNSQNNVTLGAYQETFIFASHDYSRPGNYTVTAYANTSADNSNTLSMTIEARPIEVNGLKLLNQSSLKNIYGFNIKSPDSDLNVSWTFYPQDGVAINSTQNISLTANQTIFVYFEYNYGSIGSYDVTANATDIDKRYFDFNNITAVVV
ncbi:MAG: S8 family serine peptidase [Candidatus Aenigmarchaeota archaeon]|nr:S8 family serine peptidase [Candidatus Aenigmarchaeota archaeon]